MTLCYSHRKEDPFVRLDKRIVMDNNLSWKAKGILSYAFSRPEDWQFYQKEMEKNAKDGRDSLTSGLKELEEARYLYRINRKSKETGQFEGFEWHFFEVPISEEEFKKCYRNGLSVSRETPVMGIPVTTKKDSLSKKENNKRGSVEPVVIPSQEKENQEAIYKREIQKLEDKGVLIKGNYNKSIIDRTTWYTFNNDEKMFTKDDSVSPTDDSISSIPDTKPYTKNNNKKKKEVVVFPILNELEIPDKMKAKLSGQMNEDKAFKLVQRVKAWMGRGSDRIACNTILSQWDSWEDTKSKEDTLGENTAYLRKLDDLDGRKIGDYKIEVSTNYILFRHPRIDGTKDVQFKVNDKAFIFKAQSFLRKHNQ